VVELVGYIHVYIPESVPNGAQSMVRCLRLVGVIWYENVPFNWVTIRESAYRHPGLSGVYEEPDD